MLFGAREAGCFREVHDCQHSDRLGQVPLYQIMQCGKLIPLYVLPVEVAEDEDHQSHGQSGYKLE